MTAPAKKGIYRVDCVIQGTAKESGPFQRVFTRTIIVT